MASETAEVADALLAARPYIGVNLALQRRDAQAARPHPRHEHSDAESNVRKTRKAGPLIHLHQNLQSPEGVVS